MSEWTFMIDKGTTMIHLSLLYSRKRVYGKKKKFFPSDVFYKFVPDKAGESAPAISCHKSSYDDQSVSCDISKVKKFLN